MARTRVILMAIAVVGMIMPADQGQCGPIFSRVMKSGTLRLGVPYNRVPQGFLKPTGEWVGFEVDLGSEMARHMNLKLDAVKVNEKTWPTMLAEGRIDAALVPDTPHTLP